MPTPSGDAAVGERLEGATVSAEQHPQSNVDPALLQHYQQRTQLFLRESASLRDAAHVVFLGDSMVEAYRGPLDFVNRGIASDHLQYHGVDILSRLSPDLLAPRPERIVILAGINDVNDAPAQVPVHLQTYEALLESLKRIYPQAPLTCVSLFPTRPPRENLNAAILEMNAGLAALAARLGAGYVDAHAYLQNASGQLALPYSRDGLHLSVRGYDVLTRALVDALPQGAWRRKQGLSAWRAKARRVAAQLRQRNNSQAEGDGSSTHAAEGEYVSPLSAYGSDPGVDFLQHWLRRGDDAYVELYRAVCLTAGDPPATPEEWSKKTARMLGAVDQAGALSDSDWTRLQALLEKTHSELGAVAGTLKEVKVLFLGDCLYEETALFLASECLKDGLRLVAEHIVSKNPVEQRRQLQSIDPRKYQAIFFSPFTYAFNPDYALLLELSHARATDPQIDELVKQSLSATQATLDVLANAFEGPVFINNASTVQRGTTAARRFVKATLTSRTRSRAKAKVNAALAEYVERKNAQAHRHLFIVDEAALCADEGEALALGAYYIAEHALHPTAFARKLAPLIAEQVAAAALTTKKIVVADLDNTLWDGVIGEGLGVKHHHDRQGILRKLKDKGVVLAVASKNDPARVTWEGGTLDASSFVASEISWAPKVQGIARIYQDLNIKPKDGVFIDDRTDEREMVKARWPQMHVADPCDARTWRVFASWERLLDDEQEFDRTAMYQQREKREAALSPAEAEDTAAMFGRLGLKAFLKVADKGSVKRIAELINRTNQWNLCASRTTIRQVEEWLQSPRHRVFTIQVDDKFGSMGTVCAVVAELGEGSVDVPIFVLSCRVFGFGVETLVLDYLKRWAKAKLGGPKMRGWFKPTEHNAPCKDMYRDHGFASEDGAVWTYAAAPGERAVPAWFTLNGFDTP